MHRVRLGVGLAVDDTGHVPPTLPSAAGLQPKCRINRNSAGPDASLFFVSRCDFVRCRSDQLRCSVRDLLHRRDSVHRHSRSPANSGYPPRVLAPVFAPIRLQLRCIGKFHATGVFAHFIVTAYIDIFIESAAGPTCISGLMKRKSSSKLRTNRSRITIRL